MYLLWPSFSDKGLIYLLIPLINIYQIVLLEMSPCFLVIRKTIIECILILWNAHSCQFVVMNRFMSAEQCPDVVSFDKGDSRQNSSNWLESWVFDHSILHVHKILVLPKCEEKSLLFNEGVKCSGNVMLQ